MELTELAASRGSGAVGKQAAAQLIHEAQSTVCGADGYCARRYAPAVEALRKAFRNDPAERWVPRGAGPSTVKAALRQIDTVDYLPRLIEDIAVDAAGIVDMDGGAAQTALSQLAVLVELLDAELAYDRHSLTWRRRVVDQAKTSYADQRDLKEAIYGSLEANHHNQIRLFDALVPIRGLDDPKDGRSGLQVLEQGRGVSDVIETWFATNAAEVHENPEFRDASGFLRFERHAADVDAAGRIVSRELERDIAIWRLRGGRIEEPGVAFIFDRLKSEVEIVSLPTEPLDLMPTGLSEYAVRHPEKETTAVDDALLQLAFARTAPPATALVNLWTAAEALFAGVVGDPRHEAGTVMAELAELLYIRGLLRWLDSRYTLAGFPGAVGTGSSRSGLERTGQNSRQKLNALAQKGDVLAWWRLKSVLQWRSGTNLRNQMLAFNETFQQVAARAYLIRNVAVHAAKEREIALSGTLPAFAGLVRECVGYVANNGTPDDTLFEAKSAALKVQHASAQIEAELVEPQDAVLALMSTREVLSPNEDLSVPEVTRGRVAPRVPEPEAVPIEEWDDQNLSSQAGEEPTTDASA